MNEQSNYEQQELAALEQLDEQAQGPAKTTQQQRQVSQQQEQQKEEGFEGMRFEQKEEPAKEEQQISDEEIQKLIDADEKTLTDDQRQIVADYYERVDNEKYQELSEKDEKELTQEDIDFLNKYEYDNSPVKSIVDAYSENFGVQFPENFITSNDEKGIEEVARIVRDYEAENIINNYVSVHPDIKKMHDFVSKGGDPQLFKEVFYPDIEYSEIKILPDDQYNEAEMPEQKSAREMVIVENLMLDGLSEEQALNTLEKYRQSGVEGEMAILAQKRLSSVQQLGRQNLQANQDKIYQARMEAIDAYKKDFASKIKDINDIAGLPINGNDKQQFLQFRFDRTAKSSMQNVPYSQELVYHLFNQNSPRYNQLTNMREATMLFLYHLEKDPGFLNKLVDNRSKTVATKRNKSQGFGRINQSSRVVRDRSNSNAVWEGEFKLNT